MLRISELSYKYRFGNYALTNINAYVDGGESLCVFGCATSGKTTLLKLIGGLTGGYYGNIDCKTLSPVNGCVSKDALFVSKEMLFYNKTVRYNLTYGLLLRGYSEREAIEKITSHIALLNITNLLNTKISDLNEVNLIKVLYAKILVRPAQIILIDDILSQLTDSIERNSLFKLLIDVLNEVDDKKTKNIVYATDKIEEILSFEKTLVLSYGVQQFFGCSKEVLKLPATITILDSIVPHTKKCEVVFNRGEASDTLTIIVDKDLIKLDEQYLISDIYLGKTVILASDETNYALLYDKNSERLVYFANIFDKLKNK